MLRRVLILVCLLFATEAFAAPSLLPFQGRVFDSNGNPITSNVTVSFQIFPANSTTCYLYQDTQSVTPDNLGLFSVLLGDPSNSTGPANNFADVFNDNPAGPIVDSCGGNYTPAANDFRQIQITVNGFTLPDIQTVASAPYALQAGELQGKLASDFLQVDTTATQTAMDTLTNGSDASALHNHDSRYAQLNASNTFNGSISSTGSILATSVGSAIGVGTTTPDADIDIVKSSPTERFDMAAGGGGTGTISFYSGANQRASIQAAEGSNQLTFSTGGTTALTLDAAQNATFHANVSAPSMSGTTMSTQALRIYEPTNTHYVSIVVPVPLATTFTLTMPSTLPAGGGSVLTSDTSGNLTWTNPVTGVTGTAPITITGTATAPIVNVAAATTASSGVVTLSADSATVANTVVQATDSRLNDSRAPTGPAGGDLSGNYPNPTVAQIQAVAVSATPPTDGQFMRFTATGTNWLPANIGLNDLKSTVLGNLFSAPNCSSTQTLSYSAINDQFSCISIATASTTQPGLMTVGSGLSVAGGTVSLTATGVGAGIYNSVTVDTFGRVTAGTNPTTLGGYGITDGVQNTGGAPSMSEGLDASKPAAGTAGRVYFATDTQKIYRDNGTSWDLFADGVTLGTVTSVDLSMPGIFTTSGGPITGSGTLTATLNNQALNTVFAGPASGGPATPAFRTLAPADIPNLPWSIITSGTPTTLSGYGITNGMQNNGGAPAFQEGLSTGMPAAGNAGAIFLTSDSKAIYRDNGSSWDLIASIGSGSTVDMVYGNPPLSVVNPSTNPTISISQAGTAQDGYLSQGDWNTFNNKQTATLTTGNIWVGNASNVAASVTPSGDASVTPSGVFTVGAIQGRNIAVTAPTDAQLLVWNSVSNKWTPVSFSGDATIANTGVVALKSTGTAGTYYKVTTDAQGRVTSGTATLGTTDLPALTSANIWVGNGTNAATPVAPGGDVTMDNTGSFTVAKIQGTNVSNTAPTDAQILVYNNGAAKWTPVSGSGDATVSNAGAISLKSTGTAGTYYKVTTDAQGRVTAGTNPTTLAGFGITDPIYLNGGNSFGAVANLGTNDSNGLNIRTNSTTAIAIDTSQNIGVGTSTPGAKLDVNGTIRLEGSTSGYSAITSPATAGNVTWTLPAADGLGGQTLGTDGSGHLGWQTPSTVTSVGLSMPGIFNVTNSPVTSAGTLTTTLASENANLVFAGPSIGGAATPTFRSLAATDIPNLDWSKITTGTPTTLVGYGITNAVTNLGGAPNLQEGLAAALPVAGNAGNIYLATDTKVIYRDNGTSWDTIAQAGGAAGGDLSGTYPNPTVAKIHGTPVSAAPSAGGQFLVYDGSTNYVPVTLSGDATMASSGALTLKNTGTAATYFQVTTDAQGRVTAGSNPTTLSGFGITDPIIINGGNSFGAAVNIGSNDSNVMNFKTHGSTAVTIDANQNVGIGTTAPNAKLDLSGALRFEGSTSGYLVFQAPATPANVTWTLPSADGGAGQVLKTDGAGNLSWINPVAGAVTNVATGTGLTGGPITSTGTISFANVADGNILSNISGGAAAPVPNSLTALIDYDIGNTQGAVLYRDSGAWKILAPGTAGQFLQTQGVAANPQWAGLPNPTTSSIGGVQAVAAVSHQWINAISLIGVPSLTQPAFSDISGNMTTAQFPALNSAQIWVGNGSNAATAVSPAGDMTMDNAGNFTVATVGGSTAANIHAAELAANAATSANTASKIVARDASGNFAAGQVTVTKSVMDDTQATPNTLTLQVPATITASYALKFPAAQGGANQVLVNDGSGNFSWTAQTAGSVTSVGASAPLSSTGGQTPTISISQAGTAQDGYLSQGDWNTFNGKLAAVSNAATLTSGKVWIGGAGNIAQEQTLSADVTVTASGVATVGGIQGKTVNNTAPTDGQFLVYNNGASKYTAVNMSGDATMANSGSVTLKSTGTAGTYFQVTTDAQGRVTSGTNPSTLAGFGITDSVQNLGGASSLQEGVAASLPAPGNAGNIYVATDTKVIYRDNGASWDTIAQAGGSTPGGSATGDLSGTYPSPTVAKIHGTPISAAPSAGGQFLVYDGSTNYVPVSLSGDATMASTGAVTLKNTGTSGTYFQVTTDAQGRVTSGTNPTTLTGFGITNGVQNNGGAISIEEGLDASLPSPGNIGAIYIATDTLEIYRDTGAAWQILGTGDAADLTGRLPSSDLPSLTSAQIWVGNGSNVPTGVAPGGDVTMDNGGNFAVATVGGSTAANIHSAELAANGATSASTASKIVARDTSGNFAGAQITATKSVLDDTQATPNSVTVQAPSTVTASYALNLPPAQGGSNQTLVNDGSGNLSWVNTAAGSVTSVTATSPLASSGGANPNLTIQQASGTQDGYLAQGDWTTFNNKLGTALNSAQVWVGNGSNVATPVTLGGDVSMTNAGSVTVNQIKGVGIDFSTPPANGNFFKYNGTNWVPANILSGDIPTLNQNTTGTAANVTGTVAIANGGTGAATQQAAINALTGAQSAGKYLRSDGTNSTLSAIQAADVTGSLAVANGGTGQTSFTNGQLLIGNTTGNTLVPATLTAGTGVSITNGTGSITIATTGAAPTGSASGDLGGSYPNPTVLSVADVTTGTLAIANGGTGAATQQAAMNALAGAHTSGLFLRGDGTNVTMAAIQTADVPTLNQNTTGTAANVTGTVAVGNGGTGQASYTDGQILVGKTTGNTLVSTTLTAGSGISVTNGSGSITIATTGAAPTGSASGDLGGSYPNPTVLSVADVTTGTLAIANGGTGAATQQAAMNALAGAHTSGLFLRGDGTNVTMAAIQTADVPTLNQNTTGTAANVTGTVAIANGGTGAATQQAAINALTGAQSAGKYLRSDGTNSTLSAIQAADVTGSLAVANGGTGQTSFTNGQLLIGNTTGNTLVPATLTAGTGVSITNGTGSITIATTGAAPTGSASGDLGGSYPNPTVLSVADVTTGTLAIANGGTGAATQQAAMNALAGAHTSGLFLRGDGTNVTMAAIQTADVPTLNQNTTGTAANATNAANVATTQTSTTGTYYPLFVASSTNGNQAADLGTGLTFNPNTNTLTTTTFSGALSGNATNVTGTVAVGNGGTGQTSFTDGQILVGKTTGNTLVATTLTAGSGISITNGSGTITVATTGAGPTGSASGDLGGSYPNPTVLSVADVTTGTLGFGNGGTGQTTQQAAMNALAGAHTSGLFLRGDGTNVTMAAIQAGDVPTLNQNTTGTAANATSVATTQMSTTGTYYPLFVASSTNGNQAADLGTGLTFNPNTNTLTTTTFSGALSGNATNVTGTVAVNHGGTGQTSYTNGQLLIGNTTGNTLTPATLTAGTGVSITNGTGSITIATTGAAPTGSASGDLGGSYPNPTVVSVADVTTGTLGVANGGTGIASGTAGGIPYYSASTTIASSDALTANQLVIGGGASGPSALAAGTNGQALIMSSGAPAYSNTIGGAVTLNMSFGATASTSSTTIQSGSGGIIIDPASGNTVTVGDTGGAATSTLQSGTGGSNMTSTGVTTVTSSKVAASATTISSTGGTTATTLITSNGTGTAAVDLTATGTGGGITLASNSGGITLNSGTGNITVSGATEQITPAGGFTITQAASASGPLAITTTNGQNINLTPNGSGTVNITNPNLTGNLLSGGNIVMPATASSITQAASASGALTISTTNGQNLDLSPNGAGIVQIGGTTPTISSAGNLALDSASGSTTTVGNSGSTSATTIQSGSGGISINPQSGNAVTVGNTGGGATATLQSGTGGTTVSSTGAALLTSSKVAAGATTVSTTGGTSATTLITSNGTSASAVNLTATGAGGGITLTSNTGGITIDPSSGNTVTVGDTGGAATSTLQSGTGGSTVSSSGATTITSSKVAAGATTVSTTGGTTATTLITSNGTSASAVNLTATGGGITLTSGTGGITLDPGSGNTVTIGDTGGGTTMLQSPTVKLGGSSLTTSISTNSTGLTTLNLGGASTSVLTTTLGGTSSTSSTTVQSGSGGITLNSGTGNIAVSGASTMTVPAGGFTITEAASASSALQLTSTNNQNISLNANGTGVVYVNDMLSVGTTSNTNIINLNGQAAQTISMDASTSTIGNSLTIQAGGANGSTSSNNGGDLYLSSGPTMGTGTSNIQFQTYAATTAGEPGVATTAVYIQGSTGNVGINGVTNPAYDLDAGGGTIKASNFLSTSDRRLKTNIRPIEGLSLVRQLAGVRFDWKDGKPDFGVIAQDVEKVLPEAVSTDNKGYKSVKYQNLVAPLIESVKELDVMCHERQSQYEALEKENADLKKQLQDLKDRDNKLEERLKRLEATIGMLIE